MSTDEQLIIKDKNKIFSRAQKYYFHALKLLSIETLKEQAHIEDTYKKIVQI